MSTIEKVHELAVEWERPDLVDAFASASATEWPLIVGRIAVEVAVRRCEKLLATKEGK